MVSPVLPGTGESQTGRLWVSGTMRRVVEGRPRLRPGTAGRAQVVERKVRMIRSPRASLHLSSVLCRGSEVRGHGER